MAGANSEGLAVKAASKPVVVVPLKRIKKPYILSKFVFFLLISRFVLNKKFQFSSSIKKVIIYSRTAH